MKQSYSAKITGIKAGVEGGSAAVIAGILLLLVDGFFPDIDDDSKAGAIAVGTAAIAGAFKAARNWWKQR